MDFKYLWIGLAVGAAVAFFRVRSAPTGQTPPMMRGG